MPNVKPLIPLPDYERIFRTVFTVLEGTQTRTERACIFFSLVGAALLRKAYGVQARPMGGAAAFGLDTCSGNVLTFGRMEDGFLVADEGAFHCWIECEGFAIDFMAPIFERSLRSSGSTWRVPPRMFQKPLQLMARGPYACADAAGSFYLQPDAATTMRLLKSIEPETSGADLASICMLWHQRPPRRMPETMTIGDSQGEPIELRLKGPQIVGAW